MLNKAHAILVHISTTVKSETFMKTKPGRNSSFYQVSVQTEDKKKKNFFLKKINVISPGGKCTAGKRGALNLLRPHQNFA